MTSSNGNIFHLLALCEGNSPITGEFPSQRPVMHSFDVFFDLHLNKQLSKPPRRRWFEMPSCPLWCHCNAAIKPVLGACVTHSFIIPPASKKLKGGYAGFTLSVCPSDRLSVCPSVDRIVSALYLQQYSSDPFYICTSYQATWEVVLRVMLISKFKHLKFWRIL